LGRTKSVENGDLYRFTPDRKDFRHGSGATWHET
jgi:hypothetical protein